MLDGAAIRDSRDYGARSTTARQLAMVGAPCRPGRGRARGPAGAARAAAGRPFHRPHVRRRCGRRGRAPRRFRPAARGGGDRLRLWRARLRRRPAVRRGGARAGRRAPRRAAVRRGGFPRPVGPARRRDMGRRAIGPARRGRRASPSPARWSISASPPNMAMAAGWRWGWRGCAPSISAPSRSRSRIWDGQPSNGPAGTGADVAAWTAPGRRAAASSIPAPSTAAYIRPEPRVRSAHERSLAAILFTDFAGFSTLQETRAAGLLGRGDAAGRRSARSP